MSTKNCNYSCDQDNEDRGLKSSVLPKKIGEIYTNENIIHRWHISTCDDDDTGKDSE